MEWLTLILTVLIGIVGLQYLLWRKSNKLKKLGVLHPTAWPYVGNSASVLCLRSHFTDMIESAYRFNEDADYVGFYDFSEPIILIRTPELLKSIAVKNFDHFTDHRNFLDPEANVLLSKNLFTLCGKKWREVRNILNPLFTSSKMKNWFDLMSVCGKNFVDGLIEVSLKKSNIVNTKDIFSRFSTDIIASCAFGITTDSMRNPDNEFRVAGRATNLGGFLGLKLLIARFSPLLGKLVGTSIIPRKTELFFENIIRETIELRDKLGITRTDMIQLMMESRGTKSDGSQNLTINDMAVQAFTFFAGSFESTSTVMCLIAHELAVHSEVQEKLRDEIDSVLLGANGDVTYNEIQEMQYLEAVISETLRLYPINIYLERVCVKSFQLPPALPGGKPITIEPGQNIWYPTFSVQRDPKYYPNPEKFDPERFMGCAKVHTNPFTYVPFGVGPRMCIANRFALLELKVLFFYLVAKFYLKPRPGTRSPIILTTMGFNFEPKGGYWLEIEPRTASVNE